MDKKRVIEILNNFKSDKLSIDEVLNELKDLPFKDLGFVKLDNHRELRKGFPEVIYAKSKTKEQLKEICVNLKDRDRVLFTRVGKNKADLLLSIDNELEYNRLAKIVYKNKVTEKKSNKRIVICAAGTSDIRVAEEAYVTCEVMGCNVDKYYDVGVAGIHRLFSIYDKLQEASVVIAVAGMEGALPSVISGLVSSPVIAVPTSVGYGANFGGVSALLTMLNSCSAGIVTVNIDNGFGAGYFASLIV
ncbi:MAG TPA: nickel pincer cofactor biosynthesis protein LarB [Spirochaetota bacterium]|nr:nickel pincer cofactor biosynthesis protein LarB [Spirochaetota bacterium]